MGFQNNKTTLANYFPNPGRQEGCKSKVLRGYLNKRCATNQTEVTTSLTPQFLATGGAEL